MGRILFKGDWGRLWKFQLLTVFVACYSVLPCPAYPHPHTCTLTPTPHPHPHPHPRSHAEEVAQTKADSSAIRGAVLLLFLPGSRSLVALLGVCHGAPKRTPKPQHVPTCVTHTPISSCFIACTLCTPPFFVPTGACVCTRGYDTSISWFNTPPPTSGHPQRGDVKFVIRPPLNWISSPRQSDDPKGTHNLPPFSTLLKSSKKKLKGKNGRPRNDLVLTPQATLTVLQLPFCSLS